MCELEYTVYHIKLYTICWLENLLTLYLSYVHITGAASIDVCQAYRQFVGAVVELIDGLVNDEEFKEAALAVYRLFRAPVEEEEGNRRITEKK